jgi:hypothetical protein
MAFHGGSAELPALEKDERKEMSESNQVFSEIPSQDSNLTEIRIKYYLFFFAATADSTQSKLIPFLPSQNSNSTCSFLLSTNRAYQILILFPN